MDALRKMSLMPAQRLESATADRAAEGARPGRGRRGLDDLRSGDGSGSRNVHEAGPVPSSGFRYVLVAGTPVVDDGKIAEGAHPGRAIRRSAKPLNADSMRLFSAQGGERIDAGRPPCGNVAADNRDAPQHRHCDEPCDCAQIFRSRTERHPGFV